MEAKLEEARLSLRNSSSMSSIGGGALFLEAVEEGCDKSISLPIVNLE